MNKIKIRVLYVAVFAAALSLSACGDNHDVSGNGGTESNAVRFGVASVGTRSNTIIDADEILSMGVFGYSTGDEDFDAANTSHVPNLLHNQLAERPLGGEWSYTPVAYWPVDLSVKNSFFAYSPHSSKFSTESNFRVSPTSASGYPTITYTIPSNVSDQKDILYSAPVLNKNRRSADAQVSDGRVRYDMKHALSWLSFVVAPAQFASPAETYTVTWLSLIADRIAVTSTLDLGTGTWSTPIYEQVKYEFELTAAAQNISPGEASLIVDPDNRLMLLPFVIDSADSGATIDLTFTYDSGGGSTGDPEEYYYYALLPTTNMRAGYVTIYVINISVDGISLSFKEQNRIEDWIESGEEKGIEIF